VQEAEEIRPSKRAESVLKLLEERDIPRLEAMLAEQKASGALKKDIAQTEKWLRSAHRTCRGLRKSIQELKKWQM
jgi:hypothetical protein